MARDIFKILKRMRDDIDKFMRDSNDGFKEKFPEVEGFNYPETDISEEEDELVINMDMPGMDKEDIDIDAEEDIITIKGKKKQKQEEEREGYYRSERGYKGFYRKLPLPTKIEPEKTDAKYENGVLVIRAKKQKGQKGNKVDVE